MSQSDSRASVHLFNVIAVISLCVVVGGCSPAVPPKAGHDRMLDTLKKIADETPTTHPILGTQEISRWAGEAGPDSPLSGYYRAMALFKLGKAQIDADKLRVGLESLTRAHELLPSLGDDERGQVFANELRFFLGTAYMRLGETENCCLQHSSESCIVPIQGGGLHTRQEGSREAIKYFMEVLAHPPRDTTEKVEVYEPARWLLNIAYMTIDGYPDEVPAEYLIPPHNFESQIEFPRFTNIYPQLGLDTFNLCGGAILDDFDNDYYLDIMTCSWDTTSQTQLFMNNRDGSFSEITDDANLKGFFGGLNMVQADYDNDGDTDVFITRGAWLRDYGQHPNSLLRNNGNKTFTDVTFEVGLGEVHYPTKTAAWADFDNDGDLDLYIGNESSPEISAPSQLFRNNGNGTFTDVAKQAGVQEEFFAMGAVWGDYNDDRCPDLFVAVMNTGNRLYRNNRDGTFTNVAKQAGVTKPEGSFPTWFWDFDNDGVLDLYVGCTSGPVGILSLSASGWDDPTSDVSVPQWWKKIERMALYRGDGKGGFSNVTEQQGLMYPSEPMGANFGDLNNDGFLDFYLGTGDVPYFALMPNLMFLNQQGQRFADVTMAGGFGHLQKGHGVSFADLDHDGDQDVYMQMGGAVLSDKFNDALYENPGFGNHWLTVKLVGQQSNRSAIGARIRVEIDENGQTRSIYRHVNSGGSFGCNPLRQTIGLGTATSIRKLEIFWPTTNKTQVFKDVTLDRIIRVTEGKSQFEELKLKKLKLQGRPSISTVTVEAS